MSGMMKTAATGAVLAAASWGFAGVSTFEISRATIDGGGVMRSTSGNFELSGTIGQPDAGTMTGGTFELTGGFWFQTPPADCNEDGNTNLQDVPDFAACLLGPAGAAAQGECRCFDLDGSQLVDLVDFAEVQLAFYGN